MGGDQRSWCGVGVESHGGDRSVTLGPFSVVSLPGTHSITLKLPDTMHSVHPVFHPSQLEPSAPNTIPNRVQAPPPPVEIDGKLKYEIMEILDSKVDRRRQHCQLLYLVCWSGYE